MRIAALALVYGVVAMAGSPNLVAGQAEAPGEHEAGGGKPLERLRERTQRENSRETPPQQPVENQDTPNDDKSSQNKGESLEIAGLHVSVWQPSAEAKQPAPLVIFSHGFHGLSTQSRFLMKALADDGYLVVAPNHKDSLRGGKAGGFSWFPDVGFRKVDEWTEKTYRDRGDDIRALLKALKADKNWAVKINWEQVALAGHSLGGYTVLGLAGAWPSWKTSEIKAVLAFSPYVAPFIRNGNLGGIGIPVMYQGGTRDLNITPTVKRSGGAFDLTPSPAYFVELDEAGHFAWTDLKRDFQESIIYYSLAFLNKHVKGDPTADPKRMLPNVAELRAK